MRIKINYLFLIATYLTTVFIFLYAHIQLPIFQQLFAHYAYKELPIENTKKIKQTDSNFSCIAISCTISASSFKQNRVHNCRESIANRNYYYTVGDKQYLIKKYSYIAPGNLGCNDFPIRVFYNPLFQNHAVIDNNFPEPIYWKKFLYASQIITGIIIAYLFLYKFTARFYPKPLSPEHYNINSVIIITAHFLPLILVILFNDIGLFEIIKNLARQHKKTINYSHLKDTLILGTIFLPSYFLTFFLSYKKKQKIIISLSIFITIPMFLYTSIILPNVIFALLLR